MTEDHRRPVCGIVVPISAIDGCSELHWSEVRKILNESIDDAGFRPNLVSNADDVGIIQKRIIQNLYDNPMVICDVSGKNPNVMFELGIRLAFDKPTIIVKDDKTAYSFDTAPIEHLAYPRDLRFSGVVEFKAKLAEKIRATHERAAHDRSFTTFLRHFGEFTVAKCDKKEVPTRELILQELASIRQAMNRFDRQPIKPLIPAPMGDDRLDVCMKGVAKGRLDDALGAILTHRGVKSVHIREVRNHWHVTVIMSSERSRKDKLRAFLVAQRPSTVLT